MLSAVVFPLRCYLISHFVLKQNNTHCVHILHDHIASEKHAIVPCQKCAQFCVDLCIHIGPLAGPSKCWAVSLIEEDGKTMKQSQSAWKAFIRRKRPEICPVGALFRWLFTRFTIQSEALPLPGTPDWHSSFLWPGKKGKFYTSSMHIKYFLCNNMFFVLVCGVSVCS